MAALNTYKFKRGKKFKEWNKRATELESLFNNARDGEARAFFDQQRDKFFDEFYVYMDEGFYYVEGVKDKPHWERYVTKYTPKEMTEADYNWHKMNAWNYWVKFAKQDYFQTTQSLKLVRRYEKLHGLPPFEDQIIEDEKKARLEMDNLLNRPCPSCLTVNWRKKRTGDLQCKACLEIYTKEELRNDNDN